MTKEWEVVKKGKEEKYYTFMNTKTKIVDEHKFKWCHSVVYGVATVQLQDGKWTLYDVEKQLLYDARLDTSFDVTFSECVKNCPADFLKLPTYMFKDNQILHTYLDIIKDEREKDAEFSREVDTKVEDEKEIIKIEKAERMAEQESKSIN